MYITFELIIDNKSICTFDYAFVEDEDDFSRLYCYNVISDINVLLDEQDIVTFRGYIKSKMGKYIYTEYELSIEKRINIKSSNNLILECIIDFSKQDFHDYDQDIIDLLYFWDDRKYTDLRKRQKFYNVGCLFYSGIPESLPNNLSITIDCSDINSNWYFYTMLAEKLIGDKGYIGSNLDAFNDCLRESKIIIDNKNIINLSNFDEKILSVDIIEILEEHGFIVNLI